MLSFKNCHTVFQLTFLLVLVLPPSSNAEWLQFAPGCTAGLEPAVFQNITLNDFISFDVELKGLEADTMEYDGTEYLRFTGTPGTRSMEDVGYPELPVVTCFVAVPDASDLECDLIISPADLEVNRYPTISVNGGSGEPELYVTVRNAGAVASGAFPVSLSVEYEETVWHLSARCDGLDPGEEETLQFIWNDPPSSVSGSVWGNNTYASPGTKRPPFPALGDLDNSGLADLLVATREGYVMAMDDEATVLSGLGFPYTLPSEVNGGFAVADIDNDGYVEVVFGTMDNYLHVWELGECTPGYSPWPQCQHDAARTGVLLEE